MDPIPPATRRLASVLGRERSGEILAFVGRHPYCSASEVARAHEIHIATAQKYLRELAACDLLAVRTREGGSRPIEEFALASPRIQIDIDLAVKPQKRDVAWARGLLLAEGRLGNVVYESDPALQAVREVLLVQSGPRGRVAARYACSDPLGRVLYRLPGRDADPQPLSTLMERAGLDPALIPALRKDLDALLELMPEGVLEVQDGAKRRDATHPGVT